jgi:hypothetical protein
VAYGDATNTAKIQLKQGASTLAIASGGTLGADSGSMIDLSGVAATSTLMSVQEGLIAATTQTQPAGTAITAQFSRFTTVANNGDAATLPASVAGADLTVINAGAHSLQIFPSAGGTGTEQINALGANAAISVSAGKVITFYCTLAGQWHTILSA